MAHYIQDYFYCEVPDDIIDGYLVYNTKTKKPDTAFKEDLGKVILVANSEMVVPYVCVQTSEGYDWKETTFA